MQQKASASRSWMVTLPESEYPQATVEAELSNYTYVGQLELGESTGYRHWQVYIENPTPIKFATLRKKFPMGHFEPRHSSRQSCYDYVTKDETSAGVRIQKGEIQVEDSRTAHNAVERVREAILVEGKSYRQVMMEVPEAARYFSYAKELSYIARSEQYSAKIRDDLDVTYLYGPPGVGKTSYVYNNEQDLRSIYLTSSYEHPFDEYDFQPILVLDEFAGQLSVEYLLRLLDIYPMNASARYTNKAAAWTKVFIISNIPLEELYEKVQRNRPDQFKALIRRIHHYYRMDETGELVDRLPDLLSM